MDLIPLSREVRQIIGRGEMLEYQSALEVSLRLGGDEP
jgi:hypothetical protein